MFLYSILTFYLAILSHRCAFSTEACVFVYTRCRNNCQQYRSDLLIWLYFSSSLIWHTYLSFYSYYLYGYDAPWIKINFQITFSFCHDFGFCIHSPSKQFIYMYINNNKYIFYNVFISRIFFKCVGWLVFFQVQ